MNPCTSDSRAALETLTTWYMRGRLDHGFGLLVWGLILETRREQNTCDAKHAALFAEMAVCPEVLKIQKWAKQFLVDSSAKGWWIFCHDSLFENPCQIGLSYEIKICLKIGARHFLAILENLNFSITLKTSWKSFEGSILMGQISVLYIYLSDELFGHDILPKCVPIKLKGSVE